jgi:hypothetical protein
VSYRQRRSRSRRREDSDFGECVTFVMRMALKRRSFPSGSFRLIRPPEVRFATRLRPRRVDISVRFHLRLQLFHEMLDAT